MSVSPLGGFRGETVAQAHQIRQFLRLWLTRCQPSRYRQCRFRHKATVDESAGFPSSLGERHTSKLAMTRAAEAAWAKALISSAMRVTGFMLAVSDCEGSRGNVGTQERSEEV